MKRLKNNLFSQTDTFQTDVTWDNVVWKSKHERTRVIDGFLSGQKHISTAGYSFLAPLNIDEYISNNGLARFQVFLKFKKKTTCQN